MINKLLWLFSPILFITTIVFPKNKRIWLFGAWFGEKYGDNSKALFEYTNTNNSNISAYWVYKNRSLGLQLRKLNLPCVYAFSIKGIYLHVRAKVFVSSINSSDFIPFFISFRNYYLQLGHGSPIKKIGLDMRQKNSFRYFVDLLRFKLIDNYSLVISPALAFDKPYNSAFDIQKRKIFRCGYPRNELLKVSDKRKEKIKSELGVEHRDRLLIYMPTHRNEGRIKVDSTKGIRAEVIKLLKLNEVLAKERIILLIKPHYYDKLNLSGLLDESNIKFKYETNIDLYELLGVADGLLTDYSSVVFDFELIGKPIILWPFDLDEYLSTDREMYFELTEVYDKLLNSYRINTPEDLIKLIKKPNFFRSHIGKSSTFNTPFGKYSKKIHNKLLSDLKIDN